MSQAANCPECSGAVRTQNTERVCTDCGLVVSEDRIDRGPEWRTFSDDGTGDNPERTGAPLTRSRHDRGLSTEIGRSTRLKGRKRRKFARLRRQHKRATISSKAERNQVYGFTEIRRVVGALGLPRSVRDQSCALFDSAQSEGLLRGRTIEGFAAASVYAVCRTNALSRTVGEVEHVARADEGELSAAYDAMNRELGLPTGPIDPRDYLPRYADALALPSDAERRARHHVDALETSNDIAGKNPSGVAAACLYTAAKDTEHAVTQAEAADVADVTPVTLRSTHYALQD
jgi:transcription initiation factor TFIIB